MIKIGKIYIEKENGFTRICSKISDETREWKLWFGVPGELESALVIDRADPFVLALLPIAMREGKGIESIDPMSERLHFQLRNDLIPVLSDECEFYHRVELHVPLCSLKIKSNAVVAEYSEEMDTVVFNHGEKCEYPLTHLAVFNTGDIDLLSVCRKCEELAGKHGLKTIFVDSNICEVLPEEYSDTETFRRLSCALAVQGLVSIYLLSSEHSFEHFSIDTSHDICFDPILAISACTESLRVYLSSGNPVQKTDAKEMRFSVPYRAESPLGVRICCDISFLGKTETAWFEVNEAYAGYLVDDRLDAFVVAFLPTAMRENLDMICEAPVSRRLLYQINKYLLPTLSRNIDIYNNISLIAEPTDVKLSCVGAVGTGWSGGVDSMFTLKTMLDPEEPGKKLTHLLIANSGALESDHNEELLCHLVKRAKNGISSDTGLKVVGVNTNLAVILKEHYLSVVNFRLSACVLALQKLFSVYCHSSTYEFRSFCFTGENSAYYEMFLLPMFSTENTVFYSSGEAVPRFRKLKELSDFDPARKYLHPCIYTSGANCCKCGKCVRTETALYAMGLLDRFEKVFDVAAFEENKDWYMANTIAKKNAQHYGEAYALLKQNGMITKRAEELARILRATQKVVDKNKEDLTARLEGHYE